MKTEPLLLSHSGETLSDSRANKQDTVRVDLSERGFWMAGQRHFST